MKKEHRVCKNYEFSSIIGQKQYVASHSFVCYFEKRKSEHARVGISVGKKLGNAVQRNKVKRQVRSMIDHHFNFQSGFDLILIVRPRYKDQSFSANECELEKDLARIEKRMKR